VTATRLAPAVEVGPVVVPAVATGAGCSDKVRTRPRGVGVGDMVAVEVAVQELSEDATGRVSLDAQDLGRSIGHEPEQCQGLVVVAVARPFVCGPVGEGALFSNPCIGGDDV
jgi:hypothetical protein